MRTIRLFTTRGKKASIQTNARTWGEIKAQVEREMDTSISSLIATETVNKTDLRADGAVLPEGDFTIIFRQKDTKAGADVSTLSYRECRETIRNIIAQDPSAKDFFNEGGNYTNKSTEDLRALISSWENLQEVEEEVEESNSENSDLASVLQSALAKVTDFAEESDDEEAIERAEILSEELESFINFLGNEASSTTSEDDDELQALINATA
jgi:hypothetical protein